MTHTSAQVAVAVVTIVEKMLGTGFDPLTDSILVDEIATLLEEEYGLIAPMSISHEDDWLESVYEDRTTID